MILLRLLLLLLLLLIGSSKSVMLVGCGFCDDTPDLELLVRNVVASTAVQT